MSPADLVVTDAAVLTMAPHQPRAQAVAVRGGVIAVVGSRADVEAHIGPETRVVEGGGATLLPGFVESHMHLFTGAAEMGHLQLSGVSGMAALAQAVRTYGAQNPDAAVLMAQGADYTLLGTDRPITRRELDSVMPDRPLALTAPDHHTMWANTRALEMAGLLHGLETPPGSEVVMAPDGRASGELREQPAFRAVLQLAGEERARLGLDTGRDPDPAPDAAARAADRATLRRGLDLAARHGITSIVNMDGNRYTLELLEEIQQEGGLAARVRVPFHFKPEMALEDLETASEMHARWHGDWLNSGFVKLFMDGVLDSWTAAMLNDYADRPGWRGEPLFEAERFNRIVGDADRRGLQVAVHAIGDGAVRRVLDGYSATRAENGARDSRHRIEHVELLHPDDLPRFAALGVVASMQPLHAPGVAGLPLEPTVSRIGSGRWADAFPWRSLQAAGAQLAFASDWPVSDICPLRGIEAALTRKVLAQGLPDQRIGLMPTLAAYTTGGAWAEHMEHRKGRIAPGMLADMVLLNGNIEQADAKALSRLAVNLTICGGAVTYQAHGSG